MEHRILYDLYKRQAKIIYLYLIKRGCKKEEAEDVGMYMDISSDINIEKNLLSYV